MRFERIESIPELRTLDREWQVLFKTGQHAHLANSYPYVLASAATRLSDRDWRVYLARDQGSLSAAAFGMRSTISVGKIQLPTFQIGTEFASDMLVGKAGQDEACSSLITAILDTEGVPIVDFGKLTEPAFQALKGSLRKQGLKYTWNYEGYGYVWNATIDRGRMFERLGYAQRSRVRRTSRRLHKAFKIELRRLASQDVAENLACFDDFVDLEASGWKGRAGSTIRNRPGNEAYFRMIVETAARHGMMRWYTLRADGFIAAMEMGMQTGSVFWVPKTAYDERFAKYSPGLDLAHQLHLDCIDNPKIESINWIGAASWLDAWRPNRLPYYHLRVYRTSALGRSLYEASRLYGALRRHVFARGSDEADRERRFL